MKDRFIKRLLLLATLNVCWQTNPLAMEREINATNVKQEGRMNHLGKSIEPYLLSINYQPVFTELSSASKEKYMAHFSPDPEELIKSAFDCLETYPLIPFITTSFIMKPQPRIFVTEIMPVHYLMKEKEPIGLLPPKERVYNFQENQYVEPYKSPNFRFLAIPNPEESQKQEKKACVQFTVHTVETVQNFIRSGKDLEKRQNLIIRLLNGDSQFPGEDKVLLIQGLYGLLDCTIFSDDALNQKYGKKNLGNILRKSIAYPPLSSDILVTPFPSEIIGSILNFASEEDQINFALTGKSMLMHVAEFNKPILLNHIAEEIIKNYLNRGWLSISSKDPILQAASNVRVNRMNLKVPF